MKLTPANRKRAVVIAPGLGKPTKTYTLPTKPSEALAAARKTLRENSPSKEYR